MLIAIVIIAVGAVALIGALTTSVTSSATYRSLSTIDTVLKNVAEGVKYDVQLQPTSTAMYTNCATSYQVATVYPTRDEVGAGVTVFGTDITSGASDPVSVSVGPAGTVPSQNFLSGQTVENGNVAATFTLPPTPAGTWPVRLTDTSTGAYWTTATPLTVRPSISAESPSSGGVGTSGTVSVTGFLASTALSITLDGVSASSGAMTGADGSATVTFVVPVSVPSGPQTLVVSDGTYSATSTFAVADPTYAVPPIPVPPPSAVAGYKVSIASIGWWNSSTLKFDTSPATCGPEDNSGIQMITLQATALNNVTDTLSIIVTNPVFMAPAPAPSIVVSSSGNTYNGKITFTATLTGSQGGPAPSTPGQVTWNFSSAPAPAPTCAPSALSFVGGNVSTATCVVSNAQVGTYQVAATFSGDGNYSPASGYGSATVAHLPVTVTVTASPSNPTVGQPLSFTATVAGAPGQPTPATGTITWAFTAAPSGSTPTCGSSGIAGSGNTATTTTPCTVSPTLLGTYAVTASYSGDANYLPATGSSGSVADTAFTVTSVALTNGGSTTGQIQTGDSIAIVFSAQASVNSMCSSWTGDTTNQSLTNGIVTVVDGSPSDDAVFLSSPSCTLNLGSIDLGPSAAYVRPGTGNAVFVTSAISWNASTFTLTVTLGPEGGTGVTQQVLSSSPIYSASSSMTDSWGYPVSNSPFDLSPGRQF